MLGHEQGHCCRVSRVRACAFRATLIAAVIAVPYGGDLDNRAC